MEAADWGDFFGIVFGIGIYTVAVMVVWGSYLRTQWQAKVDSRDAEIKDLNRQLRTVRIVDWGTGMEGMDDVLPGEE